MAIQKGYLGGAVLVLVSLLVAAVALEGAARIFFPHDRDHVLPGRLFDIDPRLGWKLKPNQYVRHNTRHFDVVYATNARGFRDMERHPGAPRARYRVLVYGDSQVFGWGVPINERFSNRVESTAGGLEIWNFAIPAYGLDQQILAYQFSDLDIDADEVVFFVSVATLYRARNDIMYGKPKPIFELGSHGQLQVVPPKRVTTTRWLYELMNPFYLPYVIQRRLQILAATWDNRQADNGPTPSAIALRPVEKEMLRAARVLSEQRQHKMTIIVDASEPIWDDLAAFCRSEGIGYVILDFSGSREAVMFGRDDAHWTAATHGLAATQIAEQTTWSGPPSPFSQRVKPATRAPKRERLSQ